MWPNLLSLDAPLVAVLWQALFVRCFHATGDALPAVLLVLAVWLIYAADRALDAWAGTGRRPRHEFYRRHWRAVLPVWTAVLAIAGWLAWTRLAPPLFQRGLLLLAGVMMYFAAVHFSPEGFRRAWPKEAAVAILFALGASLAALSRIRSTGDAVSILLFSCLCWINCVAIEQWEQRDPFGSRAPLLSRLCGWPIGAAAACVALAALLLPLLHRPVLGEAETASALAFVLLDRARRHFSADTLRVLADAALLSPVFFLPVAGVSV